MHFDQNCCGEAERDYREQLVGQSEKRPERVDAAERIDDALVVKRLALNPVGRRVTVQSDNPAYPDWPDCDIDDLQCIGRVIWAGRKIG